MWDTQHAVLFSQSLCMNASELKLNLPWDTELWEADTPEEWHILNSKVQSQPQYLSVLKTYINPSSASQIPALNALSRVLMLHGLMSVAWDLNRRDQTSLGTSPDFSAHSRQLTPILRSHTDQPFLQLAKPSVTRLRHLARRFRTLYPQYIANIIPFNPGTRRFSTLRNLEHSHLLRRTDMPAYRDHRPTDIRRGRPYHRPTCHAA